MGEGRAGQGQGQGRGRGRGSGRGPYLCALSQWCPSHGCLAASPLIQLCCVALSTCMAGQSTTWTAHLVAGSPIGRDVRLHVLFFMHVVVVLGAAALAVPLRSSKLWALSAWVALLGLGMAWSVSLGWTALLVLPLALLLADQRSALTAVGCLVLTAVATRSVALYRSLHLQREGAELPLWLLVSSITLHCMVPF